MMWSGSRSEMTELSELSELSEPGGGAGTPVVWRTLCDYRVSGHFFADKNEGCPYMALGKLISTPLHLTISDAELLLFLWFKNNETLTMSCVLIPIQSRCLTLYMISNSRGFNSSLQNSDDVSYRHGCVRCNGVLNIPNIHNIHLVYLDLQPKPDPKIPACHCHDVRTASLAESSWDDIMYKNPQVTAG